MRGIIALFFAAGALFAQDPALARLKREILLSRGQLNDNKATAGVAAIHGALRDWLESRLPKDIYFLTAESSSFESSLNNDLAEEGLLGPSIRTTQ